MHTIRKHNILIKTGCCEDPSEVEEWKLQSNRKQVIFSLHGNIDQGSRCDIAQLAKSSCRWSKIQDKHWL
jgi:hypothetical protein